MFVFVKGNTVVGITSDSNGVPDYDKTYVFNDSQKISLGNTIEDGIIYDENSLPTYCITKLEFMNRFTIQELATIEGISASDPVIRVLQRQQEIADFIDLQDPKTAEGIGYLASIGLITPERMTAILAVN